MLALKGYTHRKIPGVQIGRGALTINDLRAPLQHLVIIVLSAGRSLPICSIYVMILAFRIMAVINFVGSALPAGRLGQRHLSLTFLEPQIGDRLSSPMMRPLLYPRLHIR